MHCTKSYHNLTTNSYTVPFILIKLFLLKFCFINQLFFEVTSKYNFYKYNRLNHLTHENGMVFEYLKAVINLSQDRPIQIFHCFLKKITQKNMRKNQTSKDIKALGKILKDAGHLLIIIHTNPDPDAIASASALKYLADKLYGIECSIAFSGNINRSENRAMVKELNIQMKQIAKINWDKYDRVALVDTQPGSGNNVLPEDKKCDIVIDHHPGRKNIKTNLKIIHPELGAVATILIEWLEALEMDIPADLATALVYAISSESQNLNREVHKRDIDAYLSVYVSSNLRKLARIMRPPLPRHYFISVAKTLQKTVTYRNLICAHIGDVPTVEIVSEMADFLVRHERISWCMCTGRFKDRLILSLRTRIANAEAGKLLQKLVRNSKTVGGHGMSAGGFIDISDMKKNDVDILENKIGTEFAGLHNYDNPDWKSLLDTK